MILRGDQVHTSSSLSLLSLSLTEVSVSDSSPPLRAKQLSSDSILSRNLHFATSVENLCGRDACSGGAGSGSGSGGGSGGASGGASGGGGSSLHTVFCVIGAFRFAGFISSSENCCPLNRKGKTSPSLFFVHPEGQGPVW